MSIIKVENVVFDTCKCDVFFDLNNYVIENITLLSNISNIADSKYHWEDEENYGVCSLRITEQMGDDAIRELFLAIIDIPWMNNETYEYVLEMDKRGCLYGYMTVGSYITKQESGGSVPPAQNLNAVPMQRQNMQPMQGQMMMPAQNQGQYPMQGQMMSAQNQNYIPVPSPYPYSNGQGMLEYPGNNSNVKKPVSQKSPSISEAATSALCWISLSCYVISYGLFFFQFNPNNFFIRFNGIYGVTSTLMMLFMVAAIVMMIIVRADNPKRKFGLVLMIIYIVSIVLTVLGGALLTVYQIISCYHDCLYGGCNFY